VSLRVADAPGRGAGYASAISLSTQLLRPPRRPVAAKGYTKCPETARRVFIVHTVACRDPVGRPISLRARRPSHTPVAGRFRNGVAELRHGLLLRIAVDDQKRSVVLLVKRQLPIRPEYMSLDITLSSPLTRMPRTVC